MLNLALQEANSIESVQYLGDSVGDSLMKNPLNLMDKEIQNLQHSTQKPVKIQTKQVKDARAFKAGKVLAAATKTR